MFEPFDPIEEQQRLWRSPARFKVAVAGRRSGKTVLAMRNLIRKAVTFRDSTDGLFVLTAPVRDQARRNFWEKLKDNVPRRLRGGPPVETRLEIPLWNGSIIAVVGMDKPHRIEGVPVDGAVLDEYADMREEAWSKTLRPALSTRGRLGWAWFIGKPRGRNHFYSLYQKARSRAAEQPYVWDAFHWKSSEVLDPEEIKQAKADLDPLSYSQEYDADFVHFEGRAYYAYGEWNVFPVEYKPHYDLIFCFDFNSKPGTAVVLQEQQSADYVDVNLWPENLASTFTAVIDEVWIPRDSNTVKVCERLLSKWKQHPGMVFCYGDPSGGAKGSAKVKGTDWTLVRNTLHPVFGDRVIQYVGGRAPIVRDRINAVNSRLKTEDGTVHLLVNGRTAPHMILDFEGVTLKEGEYGEIDKEPGGDLTHLSDAIGYYLERKFPITSVTGTTAISYL